MTAQNNFSIRPLGAIHRQRLERRIRIRPQSPAGVDVDAPHVIRYQKPSAAVAVVDGHADEPDESVAVGDRSCLVGRVGRDELAHVSLISYVP